MFGVCAKISSSVYCFGSLVTANIIVGGKGFGSRLKLSIFVCVKTHIWAVKAKYF